MLDPASPEGEDDPLPEHGDRGGDATVDMAADTGDGRSVTGPGWFSPLRVGVVVILLVAALVAWDLARGSSPMYRTSVVGTGTVAASLDSVGTITPVNQADLNFNVSGTVSAVDVTVGQTVTAGQTLASLDGAALNATVLSAQASLASAQATLATAEASETAASTTSSKSATTATAATATTAPSSGSGGSGTDSQQITQLQAALVADQTQLDTDSTRAGVALQQATALCGSSTTSTTSTTTPSPGGGEGAPSTCSEALGQASAAQAAVAEDVKQVGADERALSGALQGTTGAGAGSADTTAKDSTAAPSSSTSNAAATAATPAASGGAGSSQGSSGQSTKKATPQQVAVDQASVDTAQANLTDAQQALAGADLVSTISGTVGSLTIADGDSVTAGSDSSSAQIVVIGTGSSYEVKTDIAVADIGRVAVGQQALVTPDSTNSVVRGQVSAIGVVATSSSTTTTYPVTISLDSPDLGQLSGADGDVQIVTKRSVNVTTVPSSAVRTVGTIHLVTVVKNGTPTPTRVTLGTVGDVLTQVTSGVSRGQLISLATLDQPLPSTTSTATRFGGGLGGGGLGGGGFGGGPGGGGFGGRFGG